MAGPAGEQCSLCYYYEPIDSETGYCRVENGETWYDRPGNAAISSFPRVRGLEDWSGDFRPLSGTVGSEALGALVTPLSTNFNVTDPVNWVKYDPGNLLDGAIMRNVTLLNGTLSWAVPGTYPPGTEWEAFISVYGSVTLPTANTFIDITVGTGGVPYSLNTTIKIQVNPQTDDLSIPFSLQGLAPATQTGSVELLMRGSIGNGLYTSAVCQVLVARVAL